MIPPLIAGPEKSPEPGERQIWVFCLYVAGEAPHSQLAVKNLRNICEEYLPNQYQINLIDVMKNPTLGLQEHIFVTPTLVRIAPQPEVRIIGNLSDRLKVLAALDLED